ncbi:MAG: hypothetical protein C0412_13755, partial [Flavobacterium sp.]|nr:hypothetical protein [Flavobacterium sp.]
MLMQYRKLVTQTALPLLAILLLSNCANTKNTKSSSPTVIIEAESFIENSGNIKVLNDKPNVGFVKTGQDGSWLSYSVNIPVSGRYMVRLYAKNEIISEVKCWLEDYIDNKDGRTYNVTGNMNVVGNSTSNFVQIDGSPFEAKTHLMKLHIEKSPLLIDKIELTLIREHKASPVVVKQNTTGKDWKLTWSDEFNG